MCIHTALTALCNINKNYLLALGILSQMNSFS